MNIAKLYYRAKEEKLYLNMETDNLSDTKEFRITDNDSLKATRYTQNTVNYLVSNAVSLQICNKCKDSNVKATEVKDIMESILADKENLDDVTRVTNTLICDFMKNNPDKSINSIDFISHSIKAKPNTKDEYILEMKANNFKIEITPSPSPSKDPWFEDKQNMESVTRGIKESKQGKTKIYTIDEIKNLLEV